LLFVTALLAGGSASSRLPLDLPLWCHGLVPYAIGSVAMFCVFDRVGALFA